MAKCSVANASICFRQRLLLPFSAVFTSSPLSMAMAMTSSSIYCRPRFPISPLRRMPRFPKSSSSFTTIASSQTSADAGKGNLTRRSLVFLPFFNSFAEMPIIFVSWVPFYCSLSLKCISSVLLTMTRLDQSRYPLFSVWNLPLTSKCRLPGAEIFMLDVWDFVYWTCRRWVPWSCWILGSWNHGLTYGNKPSEGRVIHIMFLFFLFYFFHTSYFFFLLKWVFCFQWWYHHERNVSFHEVCTSGVLDTE